MFGVNSEMTSRRKEIRCRLDLVDGCEGKDLSLVSEKALAKYREGGSIDDAEWTRIHPKILHLVDSAKSRKRDKDREAKLVECEASRKNSLRKFYDSMIEDLEEDQLPPLFVDYLFLPSVQALWRRLDEDDHREKVKKSDWIVKRDDIEAEVEDYHLDVLDKTVRLVLSTTQEYENDDDFESAVDETLGGDLDDYFSRATSMIFCDAGCETKTWITQSRNITGMGSEATKKVAAFCGTLPEVIEHQLSAHNSYNASKYLSPQEKRQSQPQHRFTLPLEVASVVSDLVDLNGSNGASVSVWKLNSLNRGQFRWTNARGRTRFGHWLDLINRVYVVARKAARSRPPINLPPPEIDWTPPHNWSAPSSGAKTQDDEKSQSEDEADESYNDTLHSKTKGKAVEEGDDDGGDEEEEEEEDELDSD